MTQTVEYQLQVYGYPWGGGRAVYTYTVPQPFGSDDHGSAERAAGDFSALIDWRLIKITREYEPGKTTCTETVLRGFRNGMKPSRFTRMMHGE